MARLTLEEIINKVEDLPALPDVVSEIMRITDDPNSTIKDMEKAIMRDQSLTTRVLKLANSAYYGYARRISTISQASVLLGFQAIRSITLTASVNGLLMKEVVGYGLEKDGLWIQSQSCAIISRHISKKLKIAKADQVYVAGLLRDIGKVIMNHYLKQEFQQVMDIVENEKVSFIEAEERVLGFHHGQVGAEVAKKWNLPNELVEAIAYHHSPEKAVENPELTAIIHLADAIVMMMGIGLGVDGMVYNLSAEALELLKVDDILLQEIMSETSDLLLDRDSFD